MKPLYPSEINLVVMMIRMRGDMESGFVDRVKEQLERGAPAAHQERTEPQEPDVVPLDDPSVPYSLVPVPGQTKREETDESTKDAVRGDADALSSSEKVDGARSGATDGHQHRDTQPDRTRTSDGRGDTAENLDVDAQRAKVAHQERTEPTLSHQFNLSAIRRWIDEGFAKWARHTGATVPNGFAGEAAAAVWLHAQEIVKVGAPARAAEWRDIESAPKDHTEILAWDDTARERFITGWDDGGWNQPSDFMHLTPTHWMPLPLPPCALTGTSETNKPI